MLEYWECFRIFFISFFKYKIYITLSFQKFNAQNFSKHRYTCGYILKHYLKHTASLCDIIEK